jgi:enoyl-CoA hydratase
MSSSGADFQTLLLDVNDDGTALLTLNRPDKLNALNKQVLDDLDRALTLVEDREDVRVLIITGKGDKAFAAGADIRELSSLDRQSGEELSLRGQSIFLKIEQLDKPVIAIVNGYALGGGAELAMACHIRIGTENAVFGLPEVSLGTIPGYGGTQRLAQLAGKARAMEMILTGMQVDAQKALDFGLLNRVSTSEHALQEARKLAGKIMKNGPLAVSKAIEAIDAGYRQAGYATEAELFGKLCESDDFKEGTAAFLEKRKAQFRGN